MGEYDVRAAAETWVRTRTPDARPHARIERMEACRIEGEIVGYIAHLAEGGYCLCGADDRLLPVRYYSPHGTYDPNSPFCQGVFDEMAHLLQDLRTGDTDLIQHADVLAHRASLWRSLMAGLGPVRREPAWATARQPDTLVLDFHLRWHQGSPYNDQCPVLTPGSDEHVAVGCCPLVMAMTMWYWKLPQSGSGSTTWWDWFVWTNTWLEEPLAEDPGINASWPWIDGNGNPRLEWTSAGGGKLRMNGYWDGTLVGWAKHSGHGIANWDDPDYQAALDALHAQLTRDSTDHYVDFGAATYDYSVMGDSLYDPPGPGDDEVAELCYHVGVAQGANWGLFGTFWGSTGSLLNRMKAWFLYDQDGYGASLDMNVLTEEIQWLRVVPLAGNGHHVLVFGYDVTDPGTPLLKIYNGWGYLANTPYGWGWYTTDAWGGGQSLAYQLAPTEAKFVGASDPGDGSPDDPYEDIAEALAEAPDYSTLVFKAWSDNRFSASSLTIDRPLTLKGFEATIQPQ